MPNPEYCANETTLLPLKIEHKGTAYQDKFKKIQKIHAFFKGFTKEYLVTEYGEKAALVVAKDGKILLARQYRLLINGLSYEIPGGKINDGESPEDGAIRECFEETGVKCRDLKHLIGFETDLEYNKNHTYVFYANDAEDPQGHKSQSVWKPLDECLKMIFKEQIKDSLSVIAILAYANTVANRVHHG